MSIVIRVATDSDIPLIREIALQIWPATYAPILSPDQIAYMLNKMYSEEELQFQFDSGHTYLIVYRDDEPVGFAGYCKRENGKWHLNKIYLADSEKRKGNRKNDHRSCNQ